MQAASPRPESGIMLSSLLFSFLCSFGSKRSGGRTTKSNRHSSCCDSKDCTIGLTPFLKKAGRSIHSNFSLSCFYFTTALCPRQGKIILPSKNQHPAQKSNPIFVQGAVLSFMPQTAPFTQTGSSACTRRDENRGSFLPRKFSRKIRGHLPPSR